jgi:hypothetical protein
MCRACFVIALSTNGNRSVKKTFDHRHFVLTVGSSMNVNIASRDEFVFLTEKYVALLNISFVAFVYRITNFNSKTSAGSDEYNTKYVMKRDVKDNL